MGRLATEQLPAVGLVGAGAWGRNILRTLHELGVPTACADADPAACEQAARRVPQLRCFPSYEALLASDVAAVAIATPAVTHDALIRAALDAGKDVFTEKPFTLDPDQAEALRRLARRRRRLLMVGHLSLFQPAVATVARCLVAGEIGRLVGLHQERLGLGRPRTVENALWCLGSHDLALQLWLLGEMPLALQVQGQCLAQPQVEDDVYLHLTYANGVQSHLHVSWAWPERRRQLTLIGSAGMLQYDELTQRVVLHGKAIGADLTPVDAGSRILHSGGGEPLRAELQHFLACVRTRRAPMVDTRLAVDVVRLLAAADSQLVRHTSDCTARPPAVAAGKGHGPDR